MNYDAINSLIGKDWVYLDNDCFAVYRKASKLLFNRDIDSVDLPEISRCSENIKAFVSAINGKFWDRIDRPNAGDAVFFFNKKGRPYHIGMYIEDGYVLHCPGTVQNPLKTTYEKLKDMNPLVYCRYEFYRPCL